MQTKYVDNFAYWWDVVMYTKLNELDYKFVKKKKMMESRYDNAG